ncbi:DUF1217 domain-containing protein [Leisingera sp. ANG-Vp]|uniref:DUF1217 domain-containing protein n=1 Tax=Leisingera sp. ANG-Vp TaxID=1577896 RepID=UPI00057D2FE0|nr:DUF1217 domain-containing protein [Leisingera sp. ANG-Vp]KIC20653.1 hypothetical protein RA20_08510 [Leisingera sp. ANG-Vp]
MQKTSSLNTTTDLFNGPQAARFALDAFGPKECSYKKAFLEGILQEGTAADDAQANRKDDAHCVQLSGASGVSPGHSLKLDILHAMTARVSTAQIRVLNRTR